MMEPTDEEQARLLYTKLMALKIGLDGAITMAEALWNKLRFQPPQSPLQPPSENTDISPPLKQSPPSKRVSLLKDLETQP